MNFIRNIIAEKRGAKSQDLGMPASVLGDRFDEAARTTPINPAYAAARPFHHVEEEAPEENIFAGDMGDADEAAAPAAPELDAAPVSDAASAFQFEPSADPEMDEDEPEMHVAAPLPEPVRSQPPLALEAGFLRTRKPLTPVVETRQTEAADLRAAFVPKLDEVSEERRLRLAMLADDPAEVEQDLPEFFGSAAAEAFSPAAQPTNQPGLSDMPFVSAQPRARLDEIVSDAGVQVPPPAAGRGSSRSGRVKTRLLGFNPESMGLVNPFEKEENRAKDAFPVGWLVVVDGPGRGASFVLHDGVSKIGRGDDQPVCLNFGDNSISRENHLSIAYDSEQNAFYIGQSGRSNIVRLNNKPLLSTEQVRSGDQIRVGETTLRLAALCSEGFSWAPKS